MPRSKVELFAATRVRELAGALAPATVAKAVNLVSLILAAAVRSQLLAVNPCTGLMLPSNRRAGDSILTVTREEFARKLLPAVPAEHQAIVCMAAGCGLRWGERAGLPWDAIDLDGAEVHIPSELRALAGVGRRADQLDERRARGCREATSSIASTAPAPPTVRLDLRRSDARYGLGGRIGVPPAAGPIRCLEPR
jgi:integrase